MPLTYEGLSSPSLFLLPPPHTANLTHFVRRWCYSQSLGCVLKVLSGISSNNSEVKLGEEYDVSAGCLLDFKGRKDGIRIY